MGPSCPKLLSKLFNLFDLRASLGRANKINDLS
jgi:hypothetical protein